MLKSVETSTAWMSSSSKDIGVRKGQAWAACNKLKKIWSSGMRRKTKIRLFLSVVEPILMYGCETWTLAETVTKRLDGCYTRMLRMNGPKYLLEAAHYQH